MMSLQSLKHPMPNGQFYILIFFLGLIAGLLYRRGNS